MMSASILIYPLYLVRRVFKTVVQVWIVVLLEHPGIKDNKDNDKKKKNSSSADVERTPSPRALYSF